MANSISVTAGTSDTIRCGAWNADTKITKDDTKITNKDTRLSQDLPRFFVAFVSIFVPFVFTIASPAATGRTGRQSAP